MGSALEIQQCVDQIFTCFRPEHFTTFYWSQYGLSASYRSRELCQGTQWFGNEGMEGSSNARIKHLTSSWDGQSRFPKLDECAHFHYEFVELGPIQVCLYDEEHRSSKLLATGDEERSEYFPIQISSMGKSWVVRRTYDNFCLLDERLHQCIYDRKFSGLPELIPSADDSSEDVRLLLCEYLERFSAIAGSLISCGPILNWFELDNRGNRLIVTDESAINTPAVAAAYVVKRYLAQASDEISFEVGDMISVIDMPPPEESVWWRGKKGFEVGFFPCECVEVIGDKLPQSINIPRAPTKPVLRKHGKLISFFRSFILSRPSRRKLKQSGILKERVFGCDLGEHLLNSQHEIPMVLTCCSQFIEEHGIVDGIYRLSGVTSNIQKLRNSFDEDRVPNLNDSAIVQDIHCVASCLKMYFRELPNPLLTYQLYDKFVSAVQTDENVRLLNMRDVVQQLPPPHYRTLEYLIRHLACVASHGAETGMTPKNVAIVWAPNLLRSKELEIGSVAALQVVGVQAIVTEYLIRYVDLIFNDKIPTFSGNKNSGGTPKKSRPKSLAISTPTKLLSLEEARSRALSTSSQPPQKYIEVGGGAATLPTKYHTVIELPHRKRGSAKLKKSPIGWKSFFSKDKKISKEKMESHEQMAANLQGRIHERATKETSQVDSGVASGKQLRSVKSAESLVSFSHSFSILQEMNLGLDVYKPDGAFKRDLSMVSRTSPHTHVRSMSHDSYFELATDDDQRIDLAPQTNEESEASTSVCSQRDTSEEHSLREDLEKSPKKHGHSPKNRLSLKAKLKQAFSSPPTTRKCPESGDKRDKCTLESEKLKMSGIDNLGVDDDEECEVSGAKSDCKVIKWMNSSEDAETRPRTSGKVIVERYGSEKTVIVEVHATQESDEEAEEPEELERKPPKIEIGSPTSVLATISDNETLSVTAADEMSDVADTSLAEGASDAEWGHSEVSTPKSFSADLLDNEVFTALAFRLDDTFFYRKSYDDTSSQEVTIQDSPIPEMQLVPSPALTIDLSESTPSPATSGEGNCGTKQFGYEVLVDEDGEEKKEVEVEVKDGCLSLNRISEDEVVIEVKEKEELVPVNELEKEVDLGVEELICGLWSPQVEDGKVLSSEISDREILSPEILSSEVLEEKKLSSGFSDPEILSSDVSDRKILSPGIFSEENNLLFEISDPKILSPGIFSEENNLFEISDPKIVSSEVSEHKEEVKLSPEDLLCGLWSPKTEIPPSELANSLTSERKEEPKTSPDSLTALWSPPEIKFDYTSPMDESKRKFESEIGRDILHERKMKLELEKIQVEHRTGPPSDAKFHALEWVKFARGSEFTKVKIATIVHDTSPQLEEVEYRRVRSHDPNPEEQKRNSEPLFRGPAENGTEKKRHSEPQMRTPVTTPPDRKASVKELLSKFEGSPKSPKTPLGEISNEISARKPPVVPKSSSFVLKSDEEKLAVLGPGSLHLSFVGDAGKKDPDHLSDLIPSNETSESARRERIDKYKEERRAQLREKIRSESFRMSQDEKNELIGRRKSRSTGTGSTGSAGSPDSDENAIAIVSYGSLRKTRIPEVHAPLGVHGDSLTRARRSSASAVPGSSSHQPPASPGRTKRLSYDAARINKPRKWPPEQEEPQLRSLPGRRSLRLAGEGEPDAAKGPTKVLRRRGSLVGSRELAFKSREADEKAASERRAAARSEYSRPKISPRSEAKSCPAEGVLLKPGKKATSPRKIKDVAAMFEKETSPPKSPVKAKPASGRVIATRARYLPQNNDKSDQNGHGKANQYLSAV